MFASAGVAFGGQGGGTGTGGSGIWASAWWQGNPKGPGPYIPGTSGGAPVCSWTDVGGTLSDLMSDLSTIGFPSSFWPGGDPGGGAGEFAVIHWADKVSKSEPSYAHFDVVACPNGGMVPYPTGNIFSVLPRAIPPSGVPTYVWIFWDTVPDPGSGPLPGVITTAYQEVPLLKPAVRTSPASVAGIAHAVVVNFPTWFWVDPSTWRTVTARAAEGDIVATVWAVPVSVTFSTNWDLTSPTEDPEGGVNLQPTSLNLTCNGPGSPYTASVSPAAASPDCGTTFTQSTMGTWASLAATVTWKVSWAITNLAGVVGGEGTLPELFSTASVPLRAVQVESVVSSN